MEPSASLVKGLLELLGLNLLAQSLDSLVIAGVSTEKGQPLGYALFLFGSFQELHQTDRGIAGFQEQLESEIICFQFRFPADAQLGQMFND